MRHVLVARLDSEGDVPLAGPAIRAVHAGAGRVTLLVGPAGRRRNCPWIIDPPASQLLEVTVGRSTHPPRRRHRQRADPGQLPGILDRSP